MVFFLTDHRDFHDKDTEERWNTFLRKYWKIQNVKDDRNDRNNPLYHT